MHEPKEQPLVDFPDFAGEKMHFAETLQIVASEREKAESDLGIVDGNDRFVQVIDDGSDDAIVQQFVLRMKLRALTQLRLSEKAPYFARLDFTPNKEQDIQLFSGMRAGERSSLYLGRWGVVKTPEYKSCVADWRSPVANLYYSGQIGTVSYDAPDGQVHGQLSLKRMFAVEDGQLLSMQDTGLLGQEKYLTDALAQVTTARLREVVTTIQAEQNVVIRHDPFTPLCVQGVAGSGKTTIALHRLAWILYRLQKTLAPHQLLVLAPNPIFLSYISRVLPDLGVDEVRQFTFAQLCARLLAQRMPRLTEHARLEARLSMTKAERDALDDILSKKGALKLSMALERFLSAFENAAFPPEDILFGGHTILTAAELKDLFLRQLRHFPLHTRVGEVRKVVSARLKKLVENIAGAVAHKVDEKLEALLHALPDGEDRRLRAQNLLKSREERLAELKTAQKDFFKTYDALWRSMDLLTVYGLFWQDMAVQDEAYAPVLAATLPLLQKKHAASEDLPTLLWIGERLYGLTRMDIRHVVIDEAQDVSPLQVKMLRRLFGHDAFTLVGDLWQGIYGDEGIRSWDDLCEGIFETRPEIATLSTSYRSTVEIVEFAQHVLSRHPLDGVSLGKPVLRHGEAPVLARAGNEKERIRIITEAVRVWQGEGFFSMAVIAKREQDAKKLHKELQAAVPEARLITQGDDTFGGGVLVMGASVVKGLEFDCVLIADADAAVYPDERFYAKLYYVLCTRPLHRLMQVSVGQESELSKAL